MNLQNKPWLQYLVLFVGLLCIGWSAIFVKLADISGFASAFYRMSIASVGVIPIWFFLRKKTPDIKAVRAAMLCGILFACDIALWNTSILLSKAAIATLLANLSPLWVGIGALFIFKEKVKPVFWYGTIISIAGVTIIVGFDNINKSSITTGSILAICASIFYAAYLLTTQKARNNIDTIWFTAISMLTSSFVLLIICLLANESLTGYSSQSWGALIGMGLISQLGGWLAINWALGYIKSTAASVSLLSQSVITALIAIPVLHEFLHASEIVGAIIVLIGIFLVNRRSFAKKTSIEPEYD